MDGELYGMEIRYITEIIGIQPITAIPEMPEYIRGITNLRGKIIPVMDARLRFKRPKKEHDDRTCIIVLEDGDLSMGLIVDGVWEVLTLSGEEMSPPPHVGGSIQEYIRGIGKKEEDVILLLDGHLLLHEEEGA